MEEKERSWLVAPGLRPRLDAPRALQSVPGSQGSLVEAGDLSRRTWSDYYTTCEELIDAFGKERRPGTRQLRLREAPA